MNENNYIGIALEELYRFFNELNKKYFKNELPIPMITIQAAKRSNLLGWFTLDKVWCSNNEELDKKYEINISAEHLNKSIEDIVETLQHEIVHYANKLADIKDYHGQYHTKKFKNLAEQVGLICTKSSKYGYGFTKASAELKTFIDSIIPNTDCFIYFRTFNSIKKETSERKKILFKYTCESCETMAKAKKDTLLICGNCRNEMIIEEE
jgi:predicted SprT family Zn-dependent metalloprotease